jgi:hypothetical protein
VHQVEACCGARRACFGFCDEAALSKYTSGLRKRELNERAQLRTVGWPRTPARDFLMQDWKVGAYIPLSQLTHSWRLLRCYGGCALRAALRSP